MAIRWRWPPDKRTPRSPRNVSSPSGSLCRNSIAAAKAAYAHDFIMSFERGYDSPCGEHGTQLSGGQRQRIAIARAFLKDAPILVLDEATSALDSEVEAAIQENLFALMQGKTVIAIAHRLSTIRRADLILLLEAGKVIERGTHEELMNARGAYYDMVVRQMLETSGENNQLIDNQVNA